jgi:phosphate transport system substrate-binding protein
VESLPNRTCKEESAMRKGSLLLVTITVVGLLLLSQLPTSVNAEERTRIRAKGAHTLANAVQSLGKSFMKSHPNAFVIASAGGSTTGIRALLNKEVELALCVRQLNDGELAKASEKGISPTFKVMGHDGVAIIVNPSNPVTELTVDQIAKIFTGEIKNWKQVGGPDRPIQVYLTDPKRHGTPGFFQKNFLKGKPYVNTMLVRRDWEPVISKVAGDPNGFSFCLTKKALDHKGAVKLLQIKKDEESPSVAMSWTTIDDGTYPLRRAVYYYWDANSATPVLREFVDYSLKKGVDLKG